MIRRHFPRMGPFDIKLFIKWLDWIPSGISLMKIRKRRGHRIEPWGEHQLVFISNWDFDLFFSFFFLEKIISVTC